MIYFVGYPTDRTESLPPRPPSLGEIHTLPRILIVDKSTLSSALKGLLNPGSTEALEKAPQPASSEELPARRTEDNIRELCFRLLAMKDGDKETNAGTQELLAALRRYIQHFRARAAKYPLVKERRARNFLQSDNAVVPERLKEIDPSIPGQPSPNTRNRDQSSRKTTKPCEE